MKYKLTPIGHFIAYLLLCILFGTALVLFNPSKIILSFACSILIIVTGVWGNIAKMMFAKIPANEYTYKITNYIIVILGVMMLIYSGYYYFPYILISNDITITKMAKLNYHFYDVASTGKYIANDINSRKIVYQGDWDIEADGSNTYHPGDSMVMLFNGQMLTIGFGNLYSSESTGEIKIDGDTAGTINNAFNQTAWNSGYLPEGVHKVEIINTGKHPHLLEVKYIEVKKTYQQQHQHHYQPISQYLK